MTSNCEITDLTNSEKKVLEKLDSWSPQKHMVGNRTYYLASDIENFLDKYKRLRIAYGRLKRGNER